MFCNKCGNEVAENLKFCTGCGELIKAATASANAAHISPTAENVVSSQTIAQSPPFQDRFQKTAPVSSPPPAVKITPIPATSQEPVMKHCRTCGSPVREKAAACVKCGVPPKIGKAFCYTCGAETRPDAVICVKCGQALTASTVSANVSEVTEQFSSLWGCFVKCLERYADFTGRARRREYWGFTLFITIFTIAGSFIVEKMPLFSMFYIVWSISLLVPTLAVTWRRFQDVGISGAAALPAVVASNAGIITLTVVAAVKKYMGPFSGLAIPDEQVVACSLLTLAGTIYLIVIAIKDSAPGENRFGPNPKG